MQYGITPQQAFNSITRVAEEPVKGALENVRHATGIGVPLAAALQVEAKRVRIGELAMLSAILATQARSGGDLAESTANLATTLRERMDSRSRMNAMTAESRITMVILVAVPVLAIGMQAFTRPELIGVMLGEARHLLGIGFGLIAGALLVARAMMRRAQQ